MFLNMKFFVCNLVCIECMQSNGIYGFEETMNSNIFNKIDTFLQGINRRRENVWLHCAGICCSPQSKFLTGCNIRGIRWTVDNSWIVVNRQNYEYLPSSITPLLYLTLLHALAIPTSHHQALCTSYKTKFCSLNTCIMGQCSLICHT